MKKDFVKKEDKLLDEIIESEHKITHLEELVVKSGQSSQTMKMISNQTNPIYHTKHKMALGNNNPCNLKKADEAKSEPLLRGHLSPNSRLFDQLLP